jgi:DNA-binding NarL/FixJ family response regulator
MRVLIADDHAIVRQGLRHLIADEFPGAECGESANALELLRLLRQGHWDAVILDISMPGQSGLEVLKEIKQERPHLPVLVLSVYSEEQYAMRVLKAGASGYLTKESAPEELVKALNKVFGGGKYISDALAEKLAFNLGSLRDRPPHEILSDREYQVLCRIASGRTVSQIAEEMTLSVKTISTYRARILEKMQMKTSAELTHYAIQSGLVE